MYDHPSQMEPLIPHEPRGSLEDLALEVIKKSSQLNLVLNLLTQKTVVKLLKSMNSYYSNLIEGHHTLPADIEKALKKEYVKDPYKRALQIESVAHIEVENLMEKRLQNEPKLSICHEDFLCWLHREFYQRLPESLKYIEGGGQKNKVIPGALRSREVSVGHHIPPTHSSLSSFLKRFEEVYTLKKYNPIEQVILAAASHHRLVWIHPFLDGNGRIARLFTHAYLIQAGVGGKGLWTISRGLARRKKNYLSALALADAPRRNDLDGRGNLSHEGLVDFCQFFLETMIDQIEFMTHLLNLEELQTRIEAYVKKQVLMKQLKPESWYLLREVLLRGEVARGEVPRITGLKERTARKILSNLLHQELLISETPKSPVRLGFPSSVVGYYFPRLYPEGVEE